MWKITSRTHGILIQQNRNFKWILMFSEYPFDHIGFLSQIQEADVAQLVTQSSSDWEVPGSIPGS